jgi:hypothetical protein
MNLIALSLYCVTICDEFIFLLRAGANKMNSNTNKLELIEKNKKAKFFGFISTETFVISQALKKSLSQSHTIRNSQQKLRTSLIRSRPPSAFSASGF